MSLYLDKRVTVNGNTSQITLDNFVNLDKYIKKLINVNVTSTGTYSHTYENSVSGLTITDTLTATGATQIVDFSTEEITNTLLSDVNEFSLERIDVVSNDVNVKVVLENTYVKLESDSISADDNANIEVDVDGINATSTNGTNSHTLGLSSDNYNVTALNGVGGLAILHNFTFFQQLINNGVTQSSCVLRYDIGDGTAGVQLTGIPTYADQAAASGAGLIVGAIYHTAGVLKIVL